MKYQLNNKFLILLLVLLTITVYGYTQTSPDSLNLDNIIEILINNNPALKQADEKVNSALLKEQLAKSSYLPNVYATAMAVKLYPVPSFDITLPDPNGGDPMSKHLQMYPDISQDYGLKFNQMVYDFGKTNNNTSLQQTYTDISRLGTDQLKQRLVLTAAGYYLNLLYIQSALIIKDDEVVTLNQHLDVIQKKQLTGSATQYEILSTKVRISATETQLTDLQTSRNIILSHLSALMVFRILLSL
jgi:outer membrane protein